MTRIFRAWPACVALLLFVTACSGQVSPAPTPIPAPTLTPSPPSATPEPRIAADVTIQSIAVGGMTGDQARDALESATAALLRPLALKAGKAQLELSPGDLDFNVDLDRTLSAAFAAAPKATVELQPRYDADKLRKTLATFNEGLLPASVNIISETGVISRSFAVAPGEQFDIDQALDLVGKRLSDPSAERSIAIEPAGQARPDAAQLQQQLDEMAKLWDGVVGAYVYDLDRDEVVASVNANTVFSGASIMKVPILLESYLQLPTFTSEQRDALHRMIVDSDNLEANSLLAATVGGASTEDALHGVQNMSKRLQELGLKHTYQRLPFEAYDYLIGLQKMKIARGPEREGEAPFTAADVYLRTTPAEISQIFLWIDQCARGSGVLLEKYGDKLNPVRCKEMLDLLAQNADHTRLVAGMPAGTAIAHKSGWTEDMHADTGLVHSPGGNFLLAVYVYRESQNDFLPETMASPIIERFARTIYTFYNPLKPS